MYELIMKEEKHINFTKEAIKKTVIYMFEKYKIDTEDKMIQEKIRKLEEKLLIAFDKECNGDVIKWINVNLNELEQMLMVVLLTE